MKFNFQNPNHVPIVKKKVPYSMNSMIQVFVALISVTVISLKRFDNPKLIVFNTLINNLYLDNVEYRFKNFFIEIFMENFSVYVPSSFL